MELQEKQLIAPVFLANISKLPAQHQDILLRITSKVFFCLLLDMYYSEPMCSFFDIEKCMGTSCGTFISTTHLFVKISFLIKISYYFTIKKKKRSILVDPPEVDDNTRGMSENYLLKAPVISKNLNKDYITWNFECLHVE